ncbi:aminodeoxychorismate lyase [Pseudomonas sp. DTU_2021_1001937_2_SI_NGA_ILE_001]|uniref:aminodeoxychorismate lyase n=1 Tax=Pseudomonas sp. DTU_2021_1001937_2_SI_NGA_ILE_001 TaxID=3077589 RepID=UPI0025FE90BC|nr:aminodeoxychorismate lyase [Pseudomonas sp. DTU_2021_1001937_2_SI_NGA_ILE_001]WNW14109.1 aminodeoxychorismate lyase [Pseudomonas sp. DTU_2021_1001937_2_SI_NGA_ILE_001]
MPAWVDGLAADSLALGNRGLAYGDGVFETLAVKAGVPLLFERHLQRLQSSCERLAIDLDLALIRDEMTRFAAQAGDGVMKLIITRGDSQRGYAPLAGAMPRRILQMSPAASYPPGHAREGIQLFECQTRLAEQPLLAGIKHLNRLEQVMARAEWQDPGFAEGLMRDMSGRPIEGVYSNLFLVRDGKLLSADLARCGVAGVMRAELLDQARTLGIVVEIRDLSMSDLQQADELFVCNSVYGVWPVRGYAGLNWPVGPLTRTLQAVAHSLLGG